MISVNFLVAVAELALPSPNVLILSALLAVVLALMHLFSSKLRFLNGTPRSLWLSIGVYLMALLGLAVFYGLERAAKVSRQRNRKAGKEDVKEAGIFWLHITSFAVYNALISYLLLHREQPGMESLLFFFFPMASRS